MSAPPLHLVVFLTICPLIVYFLRFLLGYIYTKILFEGFMWRNQSAFNCINLEEYTLALNNITNSSSTGQEGEPDQQ